MEFKDEGTRDVYHGDNTIAARRALPQELHEKAGRLLDRLNAAGAPTDLRTPRGNRLEKLSGDREGQWSIRINDQYRICFEWTSEAVNVEITDYR